MAETGGVWLSTRSKKPLWRKVLGWLGEPREAVVVAEEREPAVTIDLALFTFP